MINQELLEYIKVLSSHNQTYENSKNRLVAMNKWNVAEIDEALQFLNQNLNQENITPKNQHSIPLYTLFCLLSISSIVRFILFLQSYFEKRDVYYFMLNSWLLLIPIILALITSFTIYSTLKIKFINKKSLTLALVTVTLLNLLFSFVQTYTVYTFHELNYNCNIVTTALLGFLPGFDFGNVCPASISDLLLFPFLSLVLPGYLTLFYPLIFLPRVSILSIPIFFISATLFIKTKNTNTNKLSLIEKLILIFVVISLLSISLYAIIPNLNNVNKIKNLDSLQEAQSSTPFKIYIPSELPKGFVYTSKIGYFLANIYNVEDNEDNLKNIVSLYLGSKEDKITIHQVGVDNQFNIDDYIKNKIFFITNTDKININNSKNSAYLLEIKPTNSQSHFQLLYITKENILVDIDIFKYKDGLSTKETAIQIAESLK